MSVNKGLQKKKSGRLWSKFQNNHKLPKAIVPKTTKAEIVPEGCLEQKWKFHFFLLEPEVFSILLTDLRALRGCIKTFIPGGSTKHVQIPSFIFFYKQLQVHLILKQVNVFFTKSTLWWNNFIPSSESFSIFHEVFRVDLITSFLTVFDSVVGFKASRN